MATLSSINLSPDDMIAEADRMDQMHQDIENALENLTKIVLTLNQVWQDKAQVVFYEKYENVLKPSMGTMLDELEVYSKAVRQHANDMKATEDASVSRINKL